MYLENNKKFVVVANPKATAVELVNAVSHVLIGMVATASPEQVREMEMLDYPFADGHMAAKLSRYPVIVLQGRNGGRVHRLYRDAGAAGLRCFVFVRGMLGSSSDEQRAATAAHPIEGHDVIAACLWGDASALDVLLKRFSCFRGSATSLFVAESEPQ